MSISSGVTKQLYALSRNLCAFIDLDTSLRCEQVIAKPEWKSVRAEIAHIRSKSPGGPRYDSTMAPDEGDSFDNLILICPNHHTEIDALQVERYSVDVLNDMKNRSMANPDPVDSWASDQRLDQIAEVLVLIAEYSERAGPRPAIVNKAPIEGIASVNVDVTVTAAGTVTPPPAPEPFKFST